MTKVALKNKYGAIIMKKQFDAMELKLQGYGYPEISKILHTPDNPVTIPMLKKWFMKKGQLYELYKEWAVEELEERKITANNIMGRHVNKVARRFVEIATGKNDYAAITAGKEILDRTIGKPKEEIKHSGAIGFYTLKDLMEYYAKVGHTENQPMEKETN